MLGLMGNCGQSYIESATALPDMNNNYFSFCLLIMNTKDSEIALKFSQLTREPESKPKHSSAYGSYPLPLLLYLEFMSNNFDRTHNY